MQTTRSRRRAAPHAVVGFAALVVALGAVLAARVYLRINMTDSLPRGIYLIAPVPRNGAGRGELVVACPPRLYAEVGRTRGYLLSGSCPGDVAPVLKFVAAGGGDIVHLSSEGLSVNGKLLPHTALLHADRRGNVPRHVAFATYRVPTDEIWLFTPKDNGYDSRYFGPVSVANVLNVATPLLIAS